MFLIWFEQVCVRYNCHQRFLLNAFKVFYIYFIKARFYRFYSWGQRLLHLYMPVNVEIGHQIIN